MNERKRRSSLIGPTILIGLGIVFLLNNMGILDWNVWEVIFRLWPVLLIAAGLDFLLGRRSVWGSLLALVLTLAILAGALWLFGEGLGIGQALTTEEIVQDIDGATHAKITLEPGIGTLHVHALLGSTNLVEGTIHLDNKGKVIRDFAVEDGVASFVLESSGDTVGPIVGGPEIERVWDLGLNVTVPLDLEIGLGVGKSNLDLTGLTLSDLAVDTAIGQTTVTLPSAGDFQAKIEGAIGQTTIIIPTGLDARIRVDTGLAASQLPDNYQCQDDICTSFI